MDTRTPSSGGEEYCKLLLPGSLEVNDGPYRFWFNPDFEGAAGNYTLGREIGRWKECDRFSHCQEKNYPELDTDEAQRPGIRPEIPITYRNGKYIFDFASCRRTVMTHTGRDVAGINIGSQREGCSYSYVTTANVVYHDDLQALQFGDQKQGFDCTIPFNVGTRAFDSLDLMAELPKNGLPQYCKSNALPSAPPYPVDLKPTQGKGAAVVFTARYDTGDTGVGILQARLHFQQNAASRSDRCVVRYDPRNKSLYLNSDEPGKFLGPISAGGPDSLSNRECLVAGCSNAQISGTTLTIRFAIRFNPESFSGDHRVFMELVDTEKHATPAGDYGVWSVPPGGTVTPGPPWPSDRSCPASPSESQ